MVDGFAVSERPKEKNHRGFLDSVQWFRGTGSSSFPVKIQFLLVHRDLRSLNIDLETDLETNVSRSMV